MKPTLDRLTVPLVALMVVLAAALGLPSPAAADRAGKASDPGSAAVAGSLYPCVSELAERYAAAGGSPPTLVVGSSGKLARQIEAGAPFGLFLSADLQWLQYLDQRGLVGAQGRLASSPLVLWWPRAGAPDPSLLDGETKVAIADPEAAPFGAAARRYLEERGLYGRLLDGRRLIITATVLQAALAVQSGGAELALTALSVARELGGGYALLGVPALQHAGALVTGRSTQATEEFWAYLRSPGARTVWEAWGFAP